MKHFLRTLLYFLIIIPVYAETVGEKTNQNLSVGSATINGFSKVLLDSIPPDNTGMRNLTSVQLSKEMVPGWNAGNSLEAIGGETAWGNPLITQTLIDSIKAAGFKSVRMIVE